MAAFHTLLHEVGHTFGMMHADSPNFDAVTGESSTTSWDQGREKYTTTFATMAYADQFGYLTDDDGTGIKAAARAVRQEVAKHIRK